MLFSSHIDLEGVTIFLTEMTCLIIVLFSVPPYKVNPTNNQVFFLSDELICKNKTNQQPTLNMRDRTEAIVTIFLPLVTKPLQIKVSTPLGNIETLDYV